MLKAILRAGLLAGTLDIMAAFIQGAITRGTRPDVILKYIASGAFGPSAMEAGFGMAVLGLIFHFVIAFSCTIAFFLAYPKLVFLKWSVLLNAILIGIVAWSVTTQLIIPMSKISPSHFNLERALVAIGILIVCIGLPVAYLGKRYNERATEYHRTRLREK